MDEQDHVVGVESLLGAETGEGGCVGFFDDLELREVVPRARWCRGRYPIPGRRYSSAQRSHLAMLRGRTAFARRPPVREASRRSCGLCCRRLGCGREWSCTCHATADVAAY